MNANPLERAILLAGGAAAVARACSVSPVAVHKWRQRGRLPRTDWTGETNYAELIAEATNGRITSNELRQPIEDRAA